MKLLNYILIVFGCVMLLVGCGGGSPNYSVPGGDKVCANEIWVDNKAVGHTSFKTLNECLNAAKGHAVARQQCMDAKCE